MSSGCADCVRLSKAREPLIQTTLLLLLPMIPLALSAFASAANVKITATGCSPGSRGA
jgi:hypothetical protein